MGAPELFAQAGKFGEGGARLDEELLFDFGFATDAGGKQGFEDFAQRRAVVLGDPLGEAEELVGDMVFVGEDLGDLKEPGEGALSFHPDDDSLSHCVLHGDFYARADAHFAVQRLGDPVIERFVEGVVEHHLRNRIGGGHFVSIWHRVFQRAAFCSIAL